MFVCLCKGISESQLRELGQSGICSADELVAALDLEAEDICGRCIQHIDDLVVIAAKHLAGITTSAG